MMDYTVREVASGNVFYGSVFDFEPSREILSGFLSTDSRLLFGKKYEQFEGIMTRDHYANCGNVYSIEIVSDSVRITDTLHCGEDGENDFPSEVISREDFLWVMNEWIREDQKTTDRIEQANGETLRSQMQRTSLLRSVTESIRRCIGQKRQGK